MWITLVVLCCGFYIQKSEAQTAGTVLGTEKNAVTIECSLTGSFTLPAWRGPPNLIPYTNEGDVSETFSPNAPAASENRLVYASNKRDLLLSNAQLNDSGVYRCSFTGLGDHTVTLTVEAEATTITTSTTTASTTLASTTMTKPATATTTTPSTTTTTTPSTTTTTTPTITTTTTSTTTTSSLTTTTTPVTTLSTTSLSDEMIIVIVVVPVGVIALGGTVAFFCLFYRLRRGKRKPASHERHKLGKHYKDDMRPVQQHQQQPYILYGRGRKGKSNHRETKRLRSLHYDDSYNLYDGYHWGSQVKQNPVYKDNKNLNRLYYNETLPRNDDYRSRYTKGHVYPSHTSRHQYGPDYHGDSRRHGNRQHSPYPIYSRQQEYIDPSYSYMGY